MKMITMSDYGKSANTPIAIFFGLSTDTKPTGSFEDTPINNGSAFVEMDTGKLYFYDKTNTIWREFTEG